MPSFWRICVASTGSSLVSMAQPLAQTGNIAETGRSLRKTGFGGLSLGQVTPEPLLARVPCIERLLGRSRGRSPKAARPASAAGMFHAQRLPGKKVASYASGKVERFSRRVNEQKHQNRRHTRPRVERSSNA